MDDDFDIYEFDSSYDDSYSNSYYDDDRYSDSYDDDRYNHNYYDSLYEDDVFNSVTQQESFYTKNGYDDEIEEESEKMLDADDVDDYYEAQQQEIVDEGFQTSNIRKVAPEEIIIPKASDNTPKKRLITKAEDDFEKFFSQ